MIREWFDSTGAPSMNLRLNSGAVISIAALFFGAAVWEIAAREMQFSFLPPFSDILRATATMILDGQVLSYLAASLVSLFSGYALAVVSGVTIGLLMGRYRKIEYLLDLYLNGFLATPKLVFVPLFYALFGVNRNVQIAVVFISAVFIIILTTMNALRTVDANYLEMARAFGAREPQLFWKILIPGALPLTMAGLRLGMGRAVKGMINGEMFIAIFGLGGLLRTYGSRFDAEKVFAVLLIVISVALICDFLVQLIERRLTYWLEAGR